jgi:2-hydroxychromene-2-carboxylate isomerase
MRWPARSSLNAFRKSPTASGAISNARADRAALDSGSGGTLSRLFTRASPPLPSPIEFYFDPISPFGYLGSVLIERLAPRYGREVDWRPVLLGVTVLKVMGLKPVPETPLKGPYMHEDAPRLARLFDIPFRYHDLKGINSLAACRTFLWLKSRDPSLAKRLAQRLYVRLWVEGLDITSPEMVADEAASLGVNRAELLRALATPEVKQALADAVEAAVARGVFGVPYFIVDGEKLWGSDRVWMLEHWLQHGSWKPVSRP